MPDINTAYSVLLHSAGIEPERTAIAEQGGKWTFHKLLIETDRTADMFCGLGLKKGDKAGIVLRNSAEFVISYFAMAKLGVIAVPINFLISKKDEIEFIVKDSALKAVITAEEFIRPYIQLRNDGFYEHLFSVDGKGHKPYPNFWDMVKKSRFQPEAQSVKIFEDDVLSIIYTSGTTGNPKGAVITHKNIISNARACAEKIDVKQDDVFMCLLPMFHTFAFTATTFLPLMLGIKNVVISHLTPPQKWLAFMGFEGVTVTAAVPQLFSLLAKEARGFKRMFMRYWAFRKIRLCVSGAAPLADTTVKHFEENLNIPLLQGYGLTEASPVVSVNTIEKRKQGSVGTALSNVEAKIFDDNGNPLPAEHEGEICVRAPSVISGYHNNAEETKNLFFDGCWLRTGDIGVIDKDGFIFIRDRKKDMIIVKGLKVFPAQVEQVFLEHPSVEECAVVGIPRIDGEEIIKAFCVLKPGAKDGKHDLMKYAREKLDAYKRPREIEITDALPKNSLNKVLKRALRKKETEKRSVSV